VAVDILHEWIESNDCISARGIDRLTVGISSDSLLEPQFTAKLCSDACFQVCPNVVDLYFNLALAEGESHLSLFFGKTLLIYLFLFCFHYKDKT
jgi:hypothetical protein